MVAVAVSVTNSVTTARYKLNLPQAHPTTTPPPLPKNENTQN